MGASQSTEAATDRQMKEVGPFTLRSSEKGAIKVLSKILQELLTKNNLFDLKELLSSPTKCSDLFIVVSSTVKKEFQLLKFPDPRNPSHMATLSFLPKTDYPPKYPDSVAARERACNEITHFLIRLVTLAAACTASISRNENIASLLDISAPQTNSSKSAKWVRDIPSKYEFTNPPVDKESIEYLKSVFTQVDEKYRPNLYRFGNTYTYIVDVNKGIIYNASGTYNEGRTPVFKISFELLKDQRPLSEVVVRQAPVYGQPILFAQAPYGAAAPAPAAPAPAAPAPSGSVVTNSRPQYTGAPGQKSVATSNATSTGPSQFGVGGRRTRRHRRFLRHTRRRRQFGGLNGNNASSTASNASAATNASSAIKTATNNAKQSQRQYVKCVVEEIVYGDFRECETPSICKKLTFAIDAEANTYDWEAYERFQRDPSQAVTAAYVKQFAERIQPLFDSIINNRIMTSEYREKTVLQKDRFKPLAGATEETFKSLIDYKDTMAALPTGSAPAPYRAFLLASRLAKNGELSTFFCQDNWATQFYTATLAYSLLQALYDDGVAGTTASPRSLDSAKAMAKLFTGAEVALPAAQSGTDVDDFRNIRFAPIPSALDAYCGTASPQTTSSADDKRVLINAQQELRRLYDAHIADMVGIMKKVMFITTDPTMPGSMIFNLNERFMNDPEGGIVALEKIIQEARTLIGNHYLAVEKQYAGALQQMGRHRRGVTAINNPAIASNVLKEASAALE